jgi:hypothetical protein
MGICEECGLPIRLCNALTWTRMASQSLARNRVDEAVNSINEALAAWQAYKDELEGKDQ